MLDKRGWRRSDDARRARGRAQAARAVRAAEVRRHAHAHGVPLGAHRQPGGGVACWPCERRRWEGSGRGAARRPPQRVVSRWRADGDCALAPEEALQPTGRERLMTACTFGRCCWRSRGASLPEEATTRRRRCGGGTAARSTAQGGAARSFVGRRGPSSRSSAPLRRARVGLERARAQRRGRALTPETAAGTLSAAAYRPDWHQRTSQAL